MGSALLNVCLVLIIYSEVWQTSGGFRVKRQTVKVDGGVEVELPFSTAQCFPGNAFVKLEKGDKVTMAELQIGDRILAMDNQGYPVYSKVLMFLDIHRSQHTDFYLIQTEDGRRLTLTGSHLVHVSTSDGPPSDAIPAYADTVQVGQYVYTVDSAGKISPSNVTSISQMKEQGAYAPLTEHGTLVVNDVVSSCYAVIQNHNLAHFVFSPFRLYDKLKEYFVTSNSRNTTSMGYEVTGSVDGVHWYAHMLSEALLHIPRVAVHHRLEL